MIISKPFQPPHNLIVIGIAELLTAGLPDFLEGVNDNQLCVGVFPHKLLKLFVQPSAKLFGADGKVQVLCTVRSEHSV